MEAQNTVDNGKTTAIVAYITIIGWLIAYFGMHQSKKTSLGSYHLRQTLLLFIIAIIYQIIIRIIIMAVPAVGLILSLVGLVFLVLWIMGLIAAINGEEKPMPLIGEKAQQMFKGI
ncbi:MAG: hypothetical protein ABIR78_04785 [Ferruginibacter sp.]